MGGSLVFVAAVIFLVAHAVKNGSLGPNRFIGIRTKATKSSPCAWQEGHAAAHHWMLSSSLWALSFAVATGLAAASGLSEGAVVALGLAGYAGLIVFISIAAFVADAAAKRVVNASSEQPE
ncbi:MAG: hypothetical protein CSA58_10710 [Micrococcales bacterium]|nr:MAG: hypothetical protein CSA58_10710 [Micrococcales bacterium]